MKEIINTANAPATIGPYSQAVLLGNLLYTSGKISIYHKTNKVVLVDIKKETKLVMENLKAILTEAGMTFEHVLKATIFVSNMNDFAAINEVYGAYFNEDNAPARETVQAGNLPKYVSVEISMIASL
jgi:2-iminobutanoate/2-iminopropanoate deaminase